MLTNNSRYNFFMGKGGVGKSTVSALTALKLSADQKVLLVSMDPAHNQSDIFRIRFFEKPTRVNDNLQVIEIDTEKWIKNYLHEIEDNVRKNYTYLSAFNLEKNFKIIKYSPGIEEYALLLAFNKVCEKYSSNNLIIFDMPPTALTLKFFSLPILSLMWNNHLIKLREEIIKKKEMITNIKMNKKVFVLDKVLKKLRQQHNFYSDIKNLLGDKNLTAINLIMNTDDLSIAESRRITEKLKDIDIQINNIVINKSVDKESVYTVKEKFKEYNLIKFPLFTKPLTGVRALYEYLNSINIYDENKL